MVSLYVTGGTYELPNGTLLRGVKEMLEVLGGASAQSVSDDWGLTFMRHHLTTSQVEVIDHAHARSDSYFLNVTNRGLDHWGRWLDTFEFDEHGGWLFSSRQVVVEGSVEGSWYATASDLV